jgi:hypothetical protein
MAIHSGKGQGRVRGRGRSGGRSDSRGDGRSDGRRSRSGEWGMGSGNLVLLVLALVL